MQALLLYAKQVIYEAQLCPQTRQTQVRRAKFWCLSQSIHKLELLLHRGQMRDKQTHSHYDANQHFK